MTSTRKRVYVVDSDSTVSADKTRFYIDTPPDDDDDGGFEDMTMQEAYKRLFLYRQVVTASCNSLCHLTEKVDEKFGKLFQCFECKAVGKYNDCYSKPGANICAACYQKNHSGEAYSGGNTTYYCFVLRKGAQNSEQRVDFPSVPTANELYAEMRRVFKIGHRKIIADFKKPADSEFHELLRSDEKICESVEAHNMGAVVVSIQ